MMEIICEYKPEKGNYECHIWDKSKGIVKSTQIEDLELRNIRLNIANMSKISPDFTGEVSLYDTKVNKEVFKKGEWDSIYLAGNFKCNNYGGTLICHP